MRLCKKLNEYIDHQYSSPKGLLGIYAGEKMVNQHKTETLWTIELLKLNHRERILELGCGAGKAMEILLREAAVEYVAGLDISKTVLWSARIRNGSEIRKGRAKLVQGSVDFLGFEEESFTKVFSVHSIYFWSDLPKAISEVYRILKNNGSFVLTLSDGKNGVNSDGIIDLIDNKVIPIMVQNKLKNIEIIRGPNSRSYHTVAIRADK